MKQLDLAQPLLLIVVGYPGSGKSTLARSLAEKYRFGWVHGNRLRYELFNNPTYSKDEEEIISRLAGYILEELLRTKGHVIYDADGNTKAARQQLVKQARKAGYRTLTVWMQTDLDSAQVRATKPHKDDAFTNPLSHDLFQQFVKQFDAPKSPEDYVVISGKHTPKTQLVNLFNKVEALYKPKTQQIPVKSDNKKPAENTVSVHPTTPKQRPRFDITRRLKLR